MTKAHAYLARIKEQEEDVIAVPDGAGRALCVSSDKHWTITREWDELHVIAPLVEDEGNTNHPKPDAQAYAEWLDRALNTPDEQLVALDEARIEANIQRNRAVRECDAAVARAKQAERERDEAVRNRDEAASRLAGVRDAHRRSADAHMEWKARAEAAERERDALRGAAEAHTDPAVTKVDIEKAVAEWVDDAPEIVNEVWSMVSGSDPAVFVVRESDIAAVEVEQAEDGYWEANGDLVAMRQNTAEALRGWSLGELQMLARYEAVARAIESGRDPVDNSVEEKAKELYESANPGASWDAMVESAGRGKEVDGRVAREYRIIARHILGREATR